MPLRVLTLNTWLAPVIARDIKLRSARLPSEVAGHDADVVALQEVWMPGVRQQLIADFARLGYSHFAYREASRRLLRGLFGNGLIVFSRFPIVAQSECLEFEGYTYSSEYLARKGALWVQIDVPSLGPIDFYNAHLGAMRSGSSGEYHSEDYRRHGEQSRQLAAFVRATSRSATRVIAMDFNTAASSSNFQALYEDLGLHDSFAAATETAPRYTFDQANPYVARGAFSEAPSACLDYILLNRDSVHLVPHTSKIIFNEPVRGASFPLSDHYGVLANFKAR